MSTPPSSLPSEAPSLPPTHHLSTFLSIPPSTEPTTEYYKSQVKYRSYVYILNNREDHTITSLLSGGSGTNNYGVWSNFGEALDTVHQWIVQSTSGAGTQDASNDPTFVECLKFGDRVYLQINSIDSRWMMGLSGSTYGVSTLVVMCMILPMLMRSVNGFFKAMHIRLWVVKTLQLEDMSWTIMLCTLCLLPKPQVINGCPGVVVKLELLFVGTSTSQRMRK